MLRHQKRVLSTGAAAQTISCLEHECLTVKDFSYPEDFDYLIQKELSCFTVEVKQGHLLLRARHYLAKVVLPSGVIIEVLPKIGSSATTDSSVRRQQHILESRRWVAQMLRDIADDALYKSMAAVNWGKSATDAQSYNQMALLGLQLPPTEPQYPWYQELLNMAGTQIKAAANMVPNRYQTQVNNSPKAQGKINLKAQLKNNWHRPHYLYSEQARFGTDDLLLRFLATGWWYLQQLQWSSAHTPQRAVAGTAAPLPYAGIKRLAPNEWADVYRQIRRQTAAWSAQLRPQQQQTLNQALQWCWWLLNHSDNNKNVRPAMSMSIDAPIAALMINMHTAFERWVLGKLKQYVQTNLHGSRLVVQPRLDWLVSTQRHDTTPANADRPKTANQAVDEQATLGLNAGAGVVIQQLVPDACIYSAQDKVTHVIDIKYKTLNSIRAVSASDWQQLSAYQQRLDSVHAWLIYPNNKNFNQRLDVSPRFDENRRHNQDNHTFMSVIPFDIMQGIVLI